MRLTDHIRLYLLLALIAPWQLLTSCTKDETSLPYLNVETRDLYATKRGYGYNGLNLQLELSSNTYWVIFAEGDEEWLSLDAMGGSGDGSIEIFVNENSGPSRSAKFYVETRDNIREEFKVHQRGNEEILNYFTQDFGTGSSREAVAQYEDWDRTGVGGERVIFSGRNAYLDPASPSSAYDDASGGANLLLTGTGGVTDTGDDFPACYFQMENILIKSDRNFTLYFASMTDAASFDTDALALYLSKDNLNWTPVEYSRSANTGWEQTRLDFWLKAQNDQIYLRFVNMSEDNYRIDDLQLFEGNGSGIEVEFLEDIEIIREYVVLFEDFNWIEGGTIADGNGMGGDGGNISGNPNGMRNGWEALPTSVYRRPGYPKMGATGVMGGMLSPPLSVLQDKITDIKVTFDVAVPYNTDYTTIYVEAKNAGKIDGESSVVLDVEETVTWKEMTVKVSGATSKTQIHFRGAVSNEVMVASGRNNRLLLDNVRITYEESESEWDIPLFWADVESLSFPVNTGSSSILISGNKSWTADVTEGSGWLSVTPEEADAGTTTLTVTVTNNDTGNERRGEITVKALGEVMLTFPVTQMAGTTVGVPLNLALLEATTTNVSIVWEAPEGNGDSFNFQIATPDGQVLEQRSVSHGWKGAKHPLTAFTFPALEPSTNYVVGVQTVSTQDGLENSDYIYLDVRTTDEPVLGSEVILFNNFDGCMWGGNHMLRTYGYKPSTTNTSSQPGDERTTRSDPNAGGSSNMVDSNMNANFKASRGISGWVGLRVYENPGFIKFGANGNNGYLTTSPLSNIQGTANIRVQFRLGTWNEPSGTDPYDITCDTFLFKVDVEGPGTVVGTNGFTVTEPYTWKTFQVDIDGATADTKIYLGTEIVTPGTSSARCCLDDLLITYRN